MYYISPATPLVVTPIESAAVLRTIMATVIPVWLQYLGLKELFKKWETYGKFQIGDNYYILKDIKKHFCEYQLEVKISANKTNRHK
jgi:hypothetical protein